MRVFKIRGDQIGNINRGALADDGEEIVRSGFLEDRVQLFVTESQRDRDRGGFAEGSMN